MKRILAIFIITLSLFADQKKVAVERTIDTFKIKNTKIIEKNIGNKNLYTIDCYENNKEMTITDEDIKQIGKILNNGVIDFCFINSKSITFKGLHGFVSMFQINRMYLQNSNISNGDLVILLDSLLIKSKINLLVLYNCQLNVEAIKIFNKNSSLKYLSFVNNSYEVSDDDLKNLSANSSIQKLIISNAKITDEGLQYLKNMKNLKVFELYSDQLDGSGLGYFSDIPMRNDALFTIGGDSMKYDVLMKLSKRSPNTIHIHTEGEYGTFNGISGEKYNKLEAHLKTLNMVLDTGEYFD